MKTHTSPGTRFKGFLWENLQSNYKLVWDITCYMIIARCYESFSWTQPLASFIRSFSRKTGGIYTSSQLVRILKTRNLAFITDTARDLPVAVQGSLKTPALKAREYQDGQFSMTACVKHSTNAARCVLLGRPLAPHPPTAGGMEQAIPPLTNLTFRAAVTVQPFQGHERGQTKQET